MQRISFALVFFIAAGTTLYARVNPAAQRLIDTAYQQESVFQDSGKPFQAEFRFTAQVRVPEQGHLTLKWGSKDHWWSKVSVNGYQQITIRNGEWEYTKRNLPFTPMRIQDLFDLMNLGTNLDALVARKEKTRKKQGKEVICVQGRPQHSRQELHEDCFDAVSHELLRDTWQVPPDASWRQVYSDYFDFQGQSYPRRLDLLINESTVVSASLESVKVEPFDTALLAPPKGAIARRKCPGIRSPKAIREIYPKFKEVRDYIGDTTVELTILTDGSVGDVELIGSGGRIVDDPVLSTLKKWKFRPAMCGDTPVVSDIQIEVSYRSE